VGEIPLFVKEWLVLDGGKSKFKNAVDFYLKEQEMIEQVRRNLLFRFTKFI
jgi:hypothetical protein